MKKEKERKEKQERNVHVSSSVCTFSKRDFISTGRRRGGGREGEGGGREEPFPRSTPGISTHSVAGYRVISA
jgi:hypothetical protein